LRPELVKRTKTHDEIEKKAVKNLSEHYNVEMKMASRKSGKI
tara:strand:- start:596 stop:721 length:126 start_codon:yes stop_codon:yes gene_type:complete